MNKKIIITTLGLLAATTLVIVLFVWRSFHDATINLKKSDLIVKIYKIENNQQIEQATIEKTATLRLPNGTYSIVPQGSIYDATAIPFAVSGASTSVDVDPSLSTSQLTAILDQEVTAINTVLQARYGNILSSFDQTRGKLYREGQWYATTLAKKVSRSEEPDLYRLIMKKNASKWELVVPPSLSISIKDYPDIPEQIIRDINAIGKT